MSLESGETKSEKELDSLLEQVGGWGPYQVKNLLENICHMFDFSVCVYISHECPKHMTHILIVAYKRHVAKAF